jgi:peptide chain release factor 3
VDRFKHFEKGMQQLCDEGLTDMFLDAGATRRDPILGVVGKLQFEVVQYRLESEYGVKAAIEPLSYEIIRYLEGDEKDIRAIYWGSNARAVQTRDGKPAALINSAWHLDYLKDKNPNVVFRELRR